MEQIRTWGMTEAIRETGWKGGEAALETPLRAYGFVEEERAAVEAGGLTAAPATPAAAPAKDRLDRLVSLHVNAVLDAAKVASGEMTGLEASANSTLDHVASVPPPPPKRKKKKKGKYGGASRSSSTRPSRL